VSVTCPSGNSAEITGSRKIVNIVRVYLYEETTKYLSADFTATVPVKIEYGPNSSSLHEITKTFTLSYHKADAAKYDAKNYLSFEGAEFVRITIMGNVSPASAGGVNLTDVLMVENEMRVTRYYDLQPGVTPVTFTGPSSLTNPVDAASISWSWPGNAGNNATQLEWTWLEDELQPYYYVNGVMNYDLLFRNNATRIDLPFNVNQFKIPLFYDGVGRLYYRIRPVNIKADGSRSDGQWAGPLNCPYQGHNNDLNWQVRTSFAEDGKLKSVMEYYDGTLRSRQTVTKENIDNTTVTAETFYDYEGRPAVQILPTPGITGTDNIIKYRANLNLFNAPNATNANPADFFDLSLNTATGDDLYTTTSLSENTGAARYYSASNPDLNLGPNKNIPK